MPWTLYRYILRDLVRLLLISAAALVLVVSLAGAAKPLSEGLLRPAALGRYILYTTPTVLEFTIPYAAAFAATVVFCRMKNDNEVLVCGTAGLSYRAILWPVLLVGLALTIGLFYTSNWWTPRFYRDRQALILTEDPQVVIDMIDRGQVFRLDDLVVYADEAQTASIPPEALASDAPPVKRMVLRGVAAARYAENRYLRGEVTAEWADVYIYREGGETWATMRLRNVMAYNPTQGVLVASRDFEVGRKRVAAVAKDDTNYLSWPELRRLGQAPERFDRVARARDDLEAALQAERILQEARDRLGGGASLAMQVNDSRWYRLTASGVRRTGDVLFLASSPGQPVRLQDEVGGVVQRVVDAAEARLWVKQVDDTEIGPRIFVRMTEARVTDARTGESTGHAELALSRARWAHALLGELEGTGTREVLVAATAPDMIGSPQVAASVDYLNMVIGRLLHKAIAQLHSRAASAVAVALVLVLAALLAMRQEGGMLLAVFFWSFLAATAVVIVIEGGDQLTTRPEAPVLPGLMVLWSGNVGLLGVVVWQYLKLARN